MEVRYSANRGTPRGKPGKVIGSLSNYSWTGYAIEAVIDGDNSEDVYEATGHYPGLSTTPVSINETTYTGTVRVSKAEVLDLAEAFVHGAFAGSDLEAEAVALLFRLRETKPTRSQARG